MQLHLRHRILTLLIAPILIASGIVYFEYQNLVTIYHKVKVIELIDDINLTILELRRYEKNIQLFQEEENVRMFAENFGVLNASLQRMEAEIASDISRMQYQTLRRNIEEYGRITGELIARVKEEHRIIEDIRPLGRAIEDHASDVTTALELRRQEKNFIIYREQAAIKNAHAIAVSLVEVEPGLRIPVKRYLDAFDRFVRNEQIKAAAGDSIRNFAREIQKTATELSRMKREDISHIISAAKWSFIVSFAFLLVATVYAGYVISTRILRTVRTVSRAVQNMAKGDYTYILDKAAPAEIVAFNKNFNCTVRKLEEAKVELDLTMEKLEETNRMLIEQQEEVVERRKLTAMRLLASEIAHEVSNPLSSVIIYLGMLHETMAPDDPNKGDLSFMLNETMRCQALLRELVDFARKEPLQLKEASLSRIIQDARDSAHKQNNGKRVQTLLSLEGLPERAAVDPVLMYQVFFNLFMNAYQHTNDGDTISVQGSVEDSAARIQVRDTGAGIPRDILPSIFDPFFSTRKETGGSGLGLAITKKIIERHKGTIRVSSREGAGTVFEIALPLQAV